MSCNTNKKFYWRKILAKGKFFARYFRLFFPKYAGRVKKLRLRTKLFKNVGRFHVLNWKF